MTTKRAPQAAQAVEGNGKATGGITGKGFKPGQSGNPGGMAKVAVAMRDRARAAVDEHVMSAWIQEVQAQGPDWVRCSELLAAYGYDKPGAAKADNDAASRPLTVVVQLLAEKVKP